MIMLLLLLLVPLSGIFIIFKESLLVSIINWIIDLLVLTLVPLFNIFIFVITKLLLLILYKNPFNSVIYINITYILLTGGVPNVIAK